MLIYLLRHGDALSDFHIHDVERPLTERGKNQAMIVGKFFQKKKISINTVYYSPLKRAQETANIVNSYIHSNNFIENEYLVNGTNQRQLIQQLNDVNANTVLLVGHIPHLIETISLLVNGNYDADYEIKKCTLAIIEINRPITPGTGKLIQIINNEEMEK